MRALRLWGLRVGSATVAVGLGLRSTLDAEPTAPARPPLPAPRAACTILDSIGNTPLIELPGLSAATGCRILAKAEHLNPSGSVKDRAAKALIVRALESGRLAPGGVIVEGTGGNTGVGMALCAAALGVRAHFFAPNNISQEKIDTMETLG